MEKHIITITTDYITLGQFLKFVSLIDRGSDAKSFLVDNDVLVNGEPESRRGRKLRAGDSVVCTNEAFEIAQ